MADYNDVDGPQGGDDRGRLELLAQVHGRVERHETIRTLAICVTVMVGFICVSWAAVRIMAKPHWLVLLLALVAPSGVIVTLIRLLRSWIRRSNKRVKELENKIDPERSSSGLADDGTEPDDH